MSDSDSFLSCPCPALYVADATYHAKCPPGSTNPHGVTVTRQGRSSISYEYALVIARALAKSEAEAELRCWGATVCVTPVCGGLSGYPDICRTEDSNISQTDADAKALAAATQAAEEFCNG